MVSNSILKKSLWALWDWDLLTVEANLRKLNAVFYEPNNWFVTQCIVLPEVMNWGKVHCNHKLRPVIFHNSQVVCDIYWDQGTQYMTRKYSLYHFHHYYQPGPLLQINFYIIYAKFLLYLECSSKINSHQTRNRFSLSFFVFSGYFKVRTLKQSGFPFTVVLRIWMQIIDPFRNKKMISRCEFVSWRFEQK